MFLFECVCIIMGEVSVLLIPLFFGLGVVYLHHLARLSLKKITGKKKEKMVGL